MSLTNEQVSALQQPLDPTAVTQRSQAGKTLDYLEGHWVIARANEIFGYDAWGYSLDRLEGVAMPNGRGYVYSAVVTVLVDGCGARQDVGCGVIRNTIDDQGKEKDNVNNPDQHEMQRKAAVTDALKRALRSFGDQFGLSLYDKDDDIHRQVRQAARPAPRQPQAASNGQRPAAQPAPRPAAAAPAPAKAAARQGWAEGVGTAAAQEEQARALHAAIAPLLAADPDAAAKLPKPLDERTVDELRKTLAWLQQRAKRRAMEAAQAQQTPAQRLSASIASDATAHNKAGLLALKKEVSSTYARGLLSETERDDLLTVVGDHLNGA